MMPFESPWLHFAFLLFYLSKHYLLLCLPFTLFILSSMIMHEQNGNYKIIVAPAGWAIKNSCMQAVRGGE